MFKVGEGEVMPCAVCGRLPDQVVRIESSGDPVADAELEAFFSPDKVED